MLLLFVIVLHVEWLFKAQSGPDKGNFWLILTHRSVMSSFGGRRNYLKFSKAPARAPEHQLVLLIFVIVLHVEWLFIVLRVERLFKAQSGPDKGNFWLIHSKIRSVMSSFGGRRKWLKF